MKHRKSTHIIGRRRLISSQITLNEWTNVWMSDLDLMHDMWNKMKWKKNVNIENTCSYMVKTHTHTHFVFIKLNKNVNDIENILFNEKKERL